MKRISLQIPANADYIDIVRLSLYSVASKLGFGYEDIEDMKVAVGEACNNAVLHTVPEDGRPPVVDIAFEWNEDSLTVRIKDGGDAFDPAKALEQAAPVSGESPAELKTSGLGLYLMQALMDEVVIRTEEGTEVIMTKRLPL